MAGFLRWTRIWSPTLTRMTGPGNAAVEGPHHLLVSGGDGHQLLLDDQVDVDHRAGGQRWSGRVTQDVRWSARVGGDVRARRRSAVAVATRRWSGSGDGHGAGHAGGGVSGHRAGEGRPAGRDRDGAGRHLPRLGGKLGAIGEGEVMRDRAGVVEGDGVDAGPRHVDRLGVEAEVEGADRDRADRRARARGSARSRARQRRAGGRWRPTVLSRDERVGQGQQQDADHRGCVKEDATHGSLVCPARRALGVRPPHYRRPERVGSCAIRPIPRRAIGTSGAGRRLG